MSPKAPRCMGAPSFRPEAVMADTALQGQALDALSRNDFYGASRILLGLPERDTYAYHATASVTLAQAQHAVNLGGVNGLHAWYRNEDGSPIDPPPQPDIKAYVSVFSPSTATASALKNLGTNAKKGSIRSQVAHRLNEKRYIHATLASRLMVPKCKSPPSPNPYFDFWVWSCRSPESCGPCPSSERVATSHHGCATPSHESLEVLRTLADGRAVADIGSGNGYWTFMLRCYGLAVHPVDNMQSEWRVNWVGDTIVMDGLKWLRQNDNGKRMVLLLVYPVVGRAQQGTFTRSLVDAFEGDTLAVYMDEEHREWTRVVQIPLPSFAGKDEALYVFQRAQRA